MEPSYGDGGTKNQEQGSSQHGEKDVRGNHGDERRTDKFDRGEEDSSLRGLPRRKRYACGIESRESEEKKRAGLR